jgi:hypothetical protein
MEAPLVNVDASDSRAAKSNGTRRNPQRETEIAYNSGIGWLEFYHHREHGEKI